MDVPAKWTLSKPYCPSGRFDNTPPYSIICYVHWCKLALTSAVRLSVLCVQRAQPEAAAPALPSTTGVNHPALVMPSIYRWLHTAYEPSLQSSHALRHLETFPLHCTNTDQEAVQANLSATPSVACSSDCTVPQRMHMPLMKPGWGGHCAATIRAGGADVTRASGAGKSPTAAFAAIAAPL